MIFHRRNYKKFILLIPVILIAFFYFFRIDILFLNVFNYSKHFIFSSKIKHNLKYDKIVFLSALFGNYELSNEGTIRKYLTALSKAAPGAKVIIGISEGAKIDPYLYRYPLRIKFKVAKDVISHEDVMNKLDGNGKWYGIPKLVYYYCGVRHSFYRDYMANHPDVENIMITDIDTLIIQDPYNLLLKAPDAVHMMEDIYPLMDTDDFNYVWLNAYDTLDPEIKVKCKLHLIKDHDFLLKQIPLNAGTMLGKRENVIRISNLMYKKFQCTGMFNNSMDQGLFNYLYFSDHLTSLGIKIEPYPVESKMISCPNLMPLETFAQVAKSIHVLHHYGSLNDEYKDYLDRKVIEIIDMKP